MAKPLTVLLTTLTIASLCILTHSEDVDEGSAARILFYKQIKNVYIVENKDMIIEYGLYNHGGQPATDIRVQVGLIKVN